MEASVPSTFTPLYLFVYGTLMKGFGNHHLLETSEFIGLARTCEKYAMFAAGFPFVNPTLHRTVISGEVYLIETEEALLRLDRLEGHPDYYVRTEIDVELIDDLNKLRASIYFNSSVDDKDLPLGYHVHIPSGNFRDQNLNVWGYDE